MGDRANIVVREEDSSKGVWLYTHWHGTDLPFMLQNVLRKRQRWENGSYLTRIIFESMIPSYERGSELGFGISTNPQDGRDRILLVTVSNQTIFRASLSISNEQQFAVTKRWTFDEFISLSGKEIEQVWRKEQL